MRNETDVEPLPLHSFTCPTKADDYLVVNKGCSRYLLMPELLTFVLLLKCFLVRRFLLGIMTSIPLVGQFKILDDGTANLVLNLLKM